MTGPGRRRLVNLGLALAVVALFAAPLAFHWGVRTGGPASYAGTDSAAEQAVSRVDPGYRPWFQPLFAPGSAEVESGLFAVQAALGAGGFGFVLGRLSGRRAHPAVSDAAPSAPPGEPTGAEPRHRTVP